MKKYYSKISLIILLVISCNSKEENIKIPIKYDFNNLKLHLNSSINAPESKIDWRWDYMSSNNGIPDSIGVEHYFNINQPSFKYLYEETLPSISIKTDKNLIKEFYIVTIFHLEDSLIQTKKEVLNNLSRYGLLKEEGVIEKLIEKNSYKKEYENYFEEISFKINLKTYSRLNYKIYTKK
ncbi:hypothetical protein [Aureivirga sp. CE67]|uniref:hypothetical protein n=1 Tax=Aureivirga sp. CE67 TaxID=1788983 RepID=UPI0018CB3AE8|nr:hypothetical protein [Aureivirga sp. CE67]